MTRLQQIGRLVFLDLPLPMLQQRIRNMDSRGLVIDPGETFADLYARRLPLYRHFAELTIPCGELAPEEIAAAIESSLCRV
jgi:shikimate kinase